MSVNEMQGHKPTHGPEVEGEVIAKGSRVVMNPHPLTPLCQDAVPLGSSEERWVFLSDRGGFEGIFQDECKYVKGSILFYLHETISERTR